MVMAGNEEQKASRTEGKVVEAEVNLMGSRSPVKTVAFFLNIVESH